MTSDDSDDINVTKHDMLFGIVQETVRLQFLKTFKMATAECFTNFSSIRI